MTDGWAPSPRGPLAPGPHQAHVWRVSLRPDEARLARLEAHLSLEERARAARFRFPRDRTAFVAGRGAQREILARYTGVSASAIAYRATAYGKLALDGPAAAAGLRFNVSNSGDLALVAVTLDREVGVDLEVLREMPDGMDIARRFFSAPENEVFAALPAEARDAAFFACWTRKEAYIKAVGEGLSMPLDRFDVAFAPGQPPRLLATRGDESEASRWTMLELHPAPGYVAALVVEGGGCDAVLYDFGDREG
jgi:4'-phosphopantetheinyl transferase